MQTCNIFRLDENAVTYEHRYTSFITFALDKNGFANLHCDIYPDVGSDIIKQMMLRDEIASKMILSAIVDLCDEYPVFRQAIKKLLDDLV